MTLTLSLTCTKSLNILWFGLRLGLKSITHAYTPLFLNNNKKRKKEIVPYNPPKAYTVIPLAWFLAEMCLRDIKDFNMDHQVVLSISQ